MVFDMGEPLRKNILSALYNTRARKLAEYADTFGNDSKLAEILAISPPRLHSLIRKKSAPFTEKMARAIELKLNKSIGWLDDNMMQSDKSTYDIPVYLIEDLISLKSAQPVTFFKYITNLSDAYFIKIVSNSYQPFFSLNSMLLINPSDLTLKENSFYILLITLHNDVKLTKPVIRKFHNDHFVNPITDEQELYENYTILGKVEVAMKAVP